MNDFKEFQRVFKRYQKEFGLIGYKVYFEYKPLTDAFAEIAVDTALPVATVRLNSEDKKNPDKHIPTSAKHEAIHLLLSQLVHCGRARYVQPEEIDHAEEELVFKLETLIPDIKDKRC